MAFITERCPACKRDTTFESEDVCDGEEIECTNCGAKLMVFITVEYYLEASE